MDPVSLIVAALAAGAGAAGTGVAAGVADGAKDAVMSLYGRLKSALAGKAGDDPAAGKTLERHAGNPEGYELPVRDLVTESGADQDEAIVSLARQLLESADPAGAQVGRYNVTITGGQAVQVGEGNHQTNNFGPVLAGDVQAGRDVNVAETMHVDNRRGRA